MNACGFVPALASMLIFVCATPVAAQIKVQRISFAAGASSATIKGSITGDEIVDYKLGARAGQKMSVTLETGNTSNYFNVLPPGSKTGLFNGSISGYQWTGTLPADGDYTVRVYLMRSAARRKEKASYTLTVGITGSPDAKVAGTPYHATGEVPCSVGTDPKGSAQCSFGVIRSGAGKAEVYLANPGFDVTLHKDKLRILRFSGNSVTSSNPKEKVTATKQGDNWSISVNGFNFYTIPDTVINGG
ncbi:MAG TPA: hypothetical protein VEG60_24380 [Candidatus Binatia bacterium]|nr:hypothetical protein [Candidatus Binatia bacterium]